MIVVFRMKKILACLSIFCVCVGTFGIGYRILSSKSTYLPSANKKIIIDAGHDAQ